MRLAPLHRPRRPAAVAAVALLAAAIWSGAGNDNVALGQLANAGTRGIALRMPQSRTCPGTLRFLPGVGEMTVTAIKVTRVPCDSAKDAIVRFERNTTAGAQFLIKGRLFACSAHTIGEGMQAHTCRRASGYSVSWRSLEVI